MGGEQPPRGEALSEERLGDRSLREWHDWLVTDEETGADLSNELVMASRYGVTADSCAWWAVAGTAAYVHATGEADELRDVMVHMLGLAVNDHDDLGYLVRQWYGMLPDYLDCGRF